MRMQSAVLCGSYQAVEGRDYTAGGGYTLTGVFSVMGFSGPPPIPLSKKLILLLIDGSSGQHRLLLTVSFSEKAEPFPSHVIEFDWPESYPHQVVEIDLEFPLPGAGLYDFHVLIDGEPMGSIPLRVIDNS